MVDIHDNVGRYDAARTEKGDKWKQRQRGETGKEGKKRSEKASRRWPYGATGIPQNCARGHPRSILGLYWSFQSMSRELLPFPLVIFSPCSETLSLRTVCRWTCNRTNQNRLVALHFDDGIEINFDDTENVI